MLSPSTRYFLVSSSGLRKTLISFEPRDPVLGPVHHLCIRDSLEPSAGVSSIDFHATDPLLHRSSRVTLSPVNLYGAGGVVGMRIGVLTGGGDCPGLNVVIRAVVRKGIEVYGHEIIGFRDGWRIDNDLSATDYTVGFDTAVHIATEAIDRLRTTAESHHRTAVVEVMGRNAGWIALHSGMAGGANVILMPERPFSVDRVCQWIVRCLDRESAAIVVVAEGAVPGGGAEVLVTAEVDAFGHKRLGGVGIWFADQIARCTGAESRAVVLGHIQRGGTPTAYDRVLATRFGVHAIDAVHEGHGGVMVALRGTDIIRVKLADATAAVKTVPQERHAEAEIFFG
jgi:6-phosphofructokinase